MKTGFRIYTLVLSAWKSFAFLSALLVCFCLSPVQAQYMQLQLIVQNEVAVSSPRNLSIGVIPPAFGWVQIGPDNLLAGRFVISAAENIQVHVSLFPPDHLQLNANNTLPFRLEASYQQGSAQEGNRLPFHNHQAYFSLHGAGMLRENIPGLPSRLQTTILLHGATFVGNVAAGIYHGEIGVRVEYD